jgi:hypothetical protein
MIGGAAGPVHHHGHTTTASPTATRTSTDAATFHDPGAGRATCCRGPAWRTVTARLWQPIPAAAGRPYPDRPILG